jgi:DNA polymerase-1
MTVWAFRKIWAIDFEFRAPPGHNPEPVCMVAKELLSGHTIRLWHDELRAAASPPFDSGPDTLFVAYYASAEIGCYLALGWGIPANILDLYAEFRNLTNGLPTPCGAGLLGALNCFGLGGIQALEKDSMRELAMRGGPFTAAEQAALLDYCETDVEALARLFPIMAPRIDWPRALLRGRYMAVAAHIERNGVPIDGTMLTTLREKWGDIQDALIAAIDKDYGVYEGRTFKLERFERYLARNQIPWPRLPSGGLDLTDDTFREMARARPALAPLQDLRASLSKMKLNDLAVGPDSRNRTLLSAFRSTTGRNQPSNAKFIFGPRSFGLEGI